MDYRAGWCNFQRCTTRKPIFLREMLAQPKIRVGVSDLREMWLQFKKIQGKLVFLPQIFRRFPKNGWVFLHAFSNFPKNGFSNFPKNGCGLFLKSQNPPPSKTACFSSEL